MASYNKIKSQKVHRERHQPLMREHLGPLEKKKDYIKRSRNENLKKNIIKKLEKKALDKNPEEFNFHMIKSQLKDGIHYENVDDEEISIHDVNKDLTYVTHRRSAEKKQIQKLEARLHLIGAKPQNKHILFVDTEKEAKTTSPAKILNCPQSMLKRNFNRLTKEQVSNMKLNPLKDRKIKSLSKDNNKLYKEFSSRIEREKKLALLQDKLEVRKKLTIRKNKKELEAQPFLVKEGTKDSAPVYRWSRERKK